MQRILIIEDDEKTALALSVRLKSRGYATWTAGDALSGLSKAMRCKPDLIIMDIALPAGNGFTLAEQLEAIPETRMIPIIFATASQDPQLRQKALERGAIGLLLKPYDSDTLVSLVKHSLVGVSWRTPAVSTRPGPVSGKVKNQPVKKILIVEDDQKVALAISLRMKSAGFDTTVVHDAFSAVRSVLTDQPDTIVLDISLPAGDGFSVAQRIQAQISVPIPIIFITASKRCDLRQKARDLGAVGFFEKPYEAEGLVAAVRHAMA